MEEFRVLVGTQLKSGEIENLKNKINGIKAKPIELTIYAKKVEDKINSIKTKIEGLSKIKIDLGQGSGNSGGKAVKNTVYGLNTAYKQMLDMQRKIGSLRFQMTGLDSNTAKYKELSKQINQLEDDYEFLSNFYDCPVEYDIQLISPSIILNIGTESTISINFSISSLLCAPPPSMLLK